MHPLPSLASPSLPPPPPPPPPPKSPLAPPPPQEATLAMQSPDATDETDEIRKKWDEMIEWLEKGLPQSSLRRGSTFRASISM